MPLRKYFRTNSLNL